MTSSHPRPTVLFFGENTKIVRNALPSVVVSYNVKNRKGNETKIALEFGSNS